MNEFDIIKNYFAPLARGHTGSLNLTDDAALIDTPAGFELAITKDAISEGVHFLGSEDPPLIAQKLLRVNLSDLAAMGAKPYVYFLAIMLPKSAHEGWIERFAEGLRQDQERFGIHLAGGDTIATQGSLSFSITALGLVPAGHALRRNGAKPGDKIFVSGTLGDSALGLMSLQKHLDARLSKDDRKFLEQRYFLPEPRLVLGEQLRGIASAAIDISDGLVQDLEHICTNSGCAGEIKVSTIPLSQAGWNAIELTPEMGSLVLTGGDDYELLFTVPPDKISAVPQGCIEIGVMKPGTGVTVFGPDGTPIVLPEDTGFKHF
jgi:thiamine-monophosphate kinase